VRTSPCRGHSASSLGENTAPAESPGGRAAKRPTRFIAGIVSVVATAVAVLAVTLTIHSVAGHKPSPAKESAVRTLFGVDASSPAALAQATSEFGHMPIVRIYYLGLPSSNAWTTGAPAASNSAVIVSFNALPAMVLSGADDAALSHFFDTAPTGHPIYYCYYHEPEGQIQQGRFSLSAYKAAWAHIVKLAEAAHNPDLKSSLILTSWDLNPQSGRNWKNYLPPGGIISTLGWDDYPPGSCCSSIDDPNAQATPPADFMGPEVAAAKNAGLPFGFAEFALATPNGRPAWLMRVARYLATSGAVFGAYFNAPGPGTLNDDSASIAAWRHIVAGGVPKLAAKPEPPKAAARTAPATAPDQRR
jgi:hypothetical protein